MAFQKLLHLLAGLVKALGTGETKGLLTTSLELTVLLSSESRNRRTINGEEERAAPTLSQDVWSPFFTLLLSEPSRTLGARTVHTASDCSHSWRQAVPASEA